MADEKKIPFSSVAQQNHTNNYFKTAKVFVLVNFTCIIFEVKKLQNVTGIKCDFQIS